VHLTSSAWLVGCFFLQKINIIDTEVIADLSGDLMADDYIVNKLAERNAPLLKKLISRFKGTIKKSATVDSESIKYLKKLVSKFEKALDNAQGGVKISQIGNADEEREETADSSQQIADSETNIRFSKNKEEYPYSMQTVIKEYIDSVDEKILKAAENLRENKNDSFVRQKICDVDSEFIAEVKDIFDLNVDKFTVNINSNAFNHIEKRHGINGEADKSMANLKDLARIGYVIQNRDSLEPLYLNGEQVYSKEFSTKEGTPAPLMLLKKKINGTYYCAIAVTDGKYEKVWVQTAFINKRDGLTQILHDEISSLSQTSETVPASHPSDNSITEKGEKDNSFDENNSKNVSDERKSVKRSYEPGGESSKKITLGMSDAERTEILLKKLIKAPIYEGQIDDVLEKNKKEFEEKKIDVVKTVVETLGKEFGLLEEQIIFEDTEVEITLSKTNLRESVTKQATPEQLAKLIPILKPVAQKAIGIERHDNRYYFDNDTIHFDNLLGGYIDGKDFVPVRFGLKHSRTGNTVLYVVIDQNKIPLSYLDEIKNDTGRQDAKSDLTENDSLHRRVNYSLSQIIEFVNSEDLLRYIPDEMLSESQRNAKWQAIAKTIQTTNDKNDKKYLNYIKKGNLRDAKRMVIAAAKASGFDTRAYHYTDESFTSFDLDKSRANMDIQVFYFSQSEDAESEYGSKRYDVFLKMDNPYVVDSAEKSRAIPFDRKKNNAGIVAREWIQEQGYDSVVRDAEYYEQEADEYIIFDNKNIKSADTITYDDNGNIIPISKRFDIGNKDIRYSKQRSYNPFEDIDDEGNKFVEGEDGGTRILFSMPDFDNPAYEYGHIPDEEPDILETYKAVVSSSTEADLRKRLADATKMKVYARKEAKSAFDEIITERGYFEGLNVKFKGKSRTEIEKMLWNALNSADEGARMGPALDIAEAIITNAVVTENYEMTPELEFAYAITGYLKTHFHDLTNF